VIPKTSSFVRFKPLLLIPFSAALWPGLLAAWTPGTYPAGSSGFTVDTAVRNDVVSFWHGVYQASEGYQNRIGWTGNYTAPAPSYNGQGTTSAAFVADVARRVNFYRAMCGVPATVLFNTGSTVVIDPTDTYRTTTNPALAAATTKAAAAQQGAYMTSRTAGASDTGSPTGKPFAGFSHTPVAADCVAWTTAAWNANYHGNIGLGFYGPGAVDAYILENVAGLSEWNSSVGHRRWLLYPPATNLATGDTPGSFDSTTNVYWRSSNVMYVHQSTAEMVVPPNRFVTYPPAGFFPAPLNAARFWSLSYPGAGFAAATVTMTTAGGAAVPVTVASRSGAFGNPAIVWNVSATAAALTSVTADTTFNVTVAGITGAGVPSSYSYSVTLINPNLITSDQALHGATSLAVGTQATYKFTPPAKAEGIQVNSFQSQTTGWTEGAEDSPAPQVTPRTTGTYEFSSTAAFAGLPSFGPIAGAKSFRLTFPAGNDASFSGAPQQSFELDRELVPGAAASLNFKFRRGYLSPGSSLAVESSSDGGVTWSQLGALISGTNTPDAAASADARSLTATTVPVRVRFRLYDATGQGVYAADLYPAFPMGIWIDDITTTNCQWLELKKTNDLAAGATSFQLNATTAGVALDNHQELRLRLRTKLGNRWMPYGEMKSLAVTSASMTTTPQFSHAAGEYAAGQALTLTGENGATIFYRVNGGPTQSGASPVTGLTVPPPPATLAISAYAQKAGRADSALVEAAYTGSSSVLKTWANTYFPGITDPTTIGPAADPDRDGQPNVLEFGLGGNPNAGGGRAKLYPLTSDGSPTRKLLLTLAVRAGTPAFTGTPSPSATHEGITYTVLGGLSPNLADSPVAVAPLQTAGLPTAPAGYEYRTFRLIAADGLPSRGFMRVRVTSTP
jgi:hypothetical protein